MSSTAVEGFVRDWANENLADFGEALGDTIAGDEWARRLVLRMMAKNPEIVEAIKVGGGQAVKAAGAALEQVLKARFGWTDDQAKSVTRPLMGLLRGMLERVKRENVADGDRNGLMNALFGEMDSKRKTVAATPSQNKTCTDVTERAWLEALGGNAQTLDRLKEWKRLGRERLMAFHGSDHPMAAWAIAAVDSGDWGLVTLNDEFARQMITCHQRGMDQERTALALIGVIMEYTQESLQGRVSDSRREKLVDAAGALIKNAPETTYRFVMDKAFPFSAATWGTGGLLMVVGLVLFAYFANNCLRYGAMGDMFALADNNLYALFAILFPFSMGVQIMMAPQTIASALVRSVHETLALIPFVPEPEPINIPDDSRKIHGLQHLMLIWRWVAIGVLMGFGFMQYTGHVLVFSDYVAGKIDNFLVCEWFLIGGLILRITYRSMQLTRDTRMERFIELSSFGTAIGMAATVGVTWLSHITGMQTRSFLGGIVLNVFDMPGRLTGYSPVTVIAVGIWWFLCIVTVASAIVTVYQVIKTRSLSSAALGMVLLAALLTLGSAVLVQNVRPKSEAPFVSAFQDKYDEMGIAPLGTHNTGNGNSNVNNTAPTPLGTTGAQPDGHEAGGSVKIGGVEFKTGGSAWE